MRLPRFLRPKRTRRASPLWLQVQAHEQRLDEHDAALDSLSAQMNGAHRAAAEAKAQAEQATQAVNDLRAEQEQTATEPFEAFEPFDESEEASNE